MIQGSSGDPPRFVIAGCLNRDFLLPISGSPQINILGGNLTYTAVGLNLWGGSGGLLARVGEDYPRDWLDQLKSLGFDLSGIRLLSTPLDLRRFLAHEDRSTAYTQNPIQHFASRRLAFPSELLGYSDIQPSHASRSKPLSQTIQISDVPAFYLDSSAVHICPVDYLSHLVLPSLFRQGQASTVTMTADPGYMLPSFWEEIPGLLSELTAFITNEVDVRSLFKGRQTDLWEMAAMLAGFGPEYILIETMSQGYYLFDRISGKRWMVPNYPANAVDPTGCRDAFSGGFLAGYRQNYNALEGVLKGSIAASLVLEGSGLFFALDAMPGLVDLRLDALRERVQEI